MSPLPSGPSILAAEWEERLENMERDTHAEFRQTRRRNTRVAYDAKHKEWDEYWESQNIQTPKTLVSSRKLLHYLREHIATKEKVKGKKGLDGSRGNVGFNTLYAHMAGIIDLWRKQKEEGWNNNPHPAMRGGVVKQYMTMVLSNTSEARKKSFQERGVALATTFTAEHLMACSRHLLGSAIQTTETNSAPENPSGTQSDSASRLPAFRERLALCLSFSCILRGHVVRNADLCDFASLILPNEGVQPCTALVSRMQALQ